MKTLEIPLVVNLFGGPGCGKSTTAAHIFAELKWKGVGCELVGEHAKELVWEDNFRALTNQIKIFGEQLQRQLRLIGKVDVIITDSPVVFSAFYNNHQVPEINTIIVKEFHRFNNLNILLTRQKDYVQAGRYQNEQEAKQVDVSLKHFMDDLDLGYITLPGVRESVPTIVDLVVQQLAELKAAC